MNHKNFFPIAIVIASAVTFIFTRKSARTRTIVEVHSVKIGENAIREKVTYKSQMPESNFYRPPYPVGTIRVGPDSTHLKIGGEQESESTSNVDLVWTTYNELHKLESELKENMKALRFTCAQILKRRNKLESLASESTIPIKIK